MAGLAITLMVLGSLVLRGAALLAIVYVGTRLAIRHERNQKSEL